MMINHPNQTPIKLATTDFMDEHYANCTYTHCWFCSTFQRTDEAGYAAAIIRHQTKGN